MYKFKRAVSSMKNGKTYSVGSIVPEGFNISEMLKSGDIEKIQTEESVIEDIFEDNLTEELVPEELVPEKVKVVRPRKKSKR